MKTLQQIIESPPVFLNNWSDKDDVISDFEGIWNRSEDLTEDTRSKYEGINILFASYGTDNYEGDAWVLFEKNGELFEVCGGHCSCYGLENQWSPEPALLPELQNRLINGQHGRCEYAGNGFEKEFAEFMGISLQNENEKGDLN